MVVIDEDFDVGMEYVCQYDKESEWSLTVSVCPRWLCIEQLPYITKSKMAIHRAVTMILSCECLWGNMALGIEW